MAGQPQEPITPEVGQAPWPGENTGALISGLSLLQSIRPPSPVVDL